ncbi:MAG TPA: hypothetical protein VFV50_13320 [Bdellovibrionales bacterium]|nr:hypothetical protein [Bdellovibrionales bacterium]
MYIDAELARPAPRPIKYVPKENPTQIDPVWLCVAAIVAILVSGASDYLRSKPDEQAAMLAVFPFLLAPFVWRLVVLLRQRKLVREGIAVPALINMIPKKLWWPKDFLGFSGVIYDVQAKYEFEGKTYVADCLARDPTKWRGKYVTVVLDPKRPARAVIYQICSYQVD